MFSKAFWAAAGERAAKSFAQALLATLATAGLATSGVLAVDWIGVLSVAVGSTILSLLTSIASAKIGKDSGPSLANEKVVGKHAA